MKILLVEDEISLSDALVNILKKEKYQVDAVYNGEDGINYALTGIYDLIISFASLFMPLMTFMVQQAVFRYMISEK